MAHVRPVYVPLPYQDAAESGRHILRDGTTAMIRVARPDDLDALRAFFERLSPESRRLRFFSLTTPRADMLQSLCDPSDPHARLHLIVTRLWEGAPRIIATDGYITMDETTAEVAFAVDDAFQGKGLGCGALGLAIMALARRLHLGLSTFVSVGNKADVSGNDLLQYWEEDDETEVILLYLESFGNPRRFSRIARRVSRRKPIVAVKGGRTQAGRRAAGSHTAALAALFRQTGVIRADTLEEMFDLASALGSQPLPVGRRVGVVTNAGGEPPPIARAT